MGPLHVCRYIRVVPVEWLDSSTDLVGVWRVLHDIAQLESSPAWDARSALI